MDYPNKVLEGCFEPAIPKNEVLAAAKRILCGDVRAILPLPLIETFDRSLQVFRLPLNGSNMGACNNLLLRHDCNCTINVNVQLIAQLMYMYINWALRTCRTEYNRTVLSHVSQYILVYVHSVPNPTVTFCVIINASYSCIRSQTLLK